MGKPLDKISANTNAIRRVCCRQPQPQQIIHFHLFLGVGPNVTRPEVQGPEPQVLNQALGRIRCTLAARPLQSRPSISSFPSFKCLSKII